MGIASKVILSLYTIVSIILFFTTSPSQSSLLRFFYMRLTEVQKFLWLDSIFCDCGNLWPEEGRRKRVLLFNSFFLDQKYFYKAKIDILIIAALLIICILVENWPTFAILTQTAGISFKIKFQFNFCLSLWSKGPFKIHKNSNTFFWSLFK